jgi:hypothetical protein
MKMTIYRLTQRSTFFERGRSFHDTKDYKSWAGMKFGSSPRTKNWNQDF